MSPNAPVRGSAPTAPAAGATAPGTRAGAAASATPAAAAAPEGHSAGARVPCPAPIVPASGAPRLTVPAASAGGARQAGPLGAPEADAAPQSTRGGTAAAPTLRRSRRALLRRRSSPAVAQRMAPTPRRSRRPLLRRRSWQAACHLPVEPAVRRREHRRSSPAMLRAAHAGCRCGAPFPRLSGVTSGYATGALLLSGSAHRAPLRFFSPATDRPPAAGCRGWRPGTGQSRVLCPPPHAPRLRTSAAGGAVEVARPPRRGRVRSWPPVAGSCKLSSIRERLSAVILYGSVARGRAQAASDLDLFVVHRGPRAAVFEVSASRAAVAGPSARMRVADAQGPDRAVRGVPYRLGAGRYPWLLLDICDHGIILFDPRSVGRSG